MSLHRADLVEAFSTVGPVARVHLSRDHALITFKEPRAAAYAIRTFDGGKLGDRTIDVYMHGKEGPLPGGGGGGGRTREEPERCSRQEPDPKRARREDVPVRSS